MHSCTSPKDGLSTFTIGDTIVRKGKVPWTVLQLRRVRQGDKSVAKAVVTPRSALLDETDLADAKVELVGLDKARREEGQAGLTEEAATKGSNILERFMQQNNQEPLQRGRSPKPAPAPAKKAATVAPRFTKTRVASASSTDSVESSAEEEDEEEAATHVGKLPRHARETPQQSKRTTRSTQKKKSAANSKARKDTRATRNRTNKKRPRREPEASIDSEADEEAPTQMQLVPSAPPKRRAVAPAATTPAPAAVSQSHQALPLAMAPAFQPAATLGASGAPPTASLAFQQLLRLDAFHLRQMELEQTRIYQGQEMENMRNFWMSHMNQQ